ncbi:MAG: hypothetical protein KBT11_03500 [Treponema sp.]|nr:hypothetical protein [Candidatus Treponema equifaecale]
MKILCICLSATIQRTLSFDNFSETKVNRANSFIENASGKALNTARVLNQLKKDSTIVICPVGTENKNAFLKLVKNDSLNLNPIYIPGKTRSCWTLLSINGDTTEVVCDEPKQNFTKRQLKSIERKLLKKIERKLENIDCVILSGSTPKHFSEDLCSRICSLVKSKEKMLLVDFIGSQLTNTLESSTPDFIKINKEEFESTFNTEFSSEQVQAFAQKHKTTFIITNGINPTLGSNGEDLIEAPIEKVTPVNITACGDSFNAGFVYDYLSNKNLKSAIEFGNSTASKNACTLVPGSIL